MCQVLFCTGGEQWAKEITIPLGAFYMLVGMSVGDGGDRK